MNNPMICWLCGGKINKTTAEKLRTPIEELGLSNRAINCLARRGIEYVEELIKLDTIELLKIRRLGRVSLSEINEKVKAFGFNGWNESTTFGDLR